MPCTFSIKNHSSSSQEIGQLRLELGSANISKLKQKSPEAFVLLQSVECPSLGLIEPKEQKQFSFSFQLDKNCTITDKSHSLCLLFGLTDNPEKTSTVLVLVRPHKHFRQVLDILQGNYQFLLKSEKFSDSSVQAKLKAPSARKYSFVEELQLGLQFDGDYLVLKYVFKVKKIQATAASVGIKKAKVEEVQSLDPKEYLLTSEHVNPDVVTRKIEEALEIVSTGL